MSSASPESVDHWLELDCPRCKAKFRIKSAYAHMSGRCPSCGMFIEAPRPIPPPAPASFDSDEPLGLVPIEEEWPEPAQMDVDDRRHYDFGALPSHWAEPKPQKSPDVESYGFEDGPLATPPPSVAELNSAPYSKQIPRIEPAPRPTSTPPSKEAYQVDLPVSPPPAAPAVPVVEKKEPERVPPPPPLPPAFPLWRGVYTFPWRLENLKVWIALGLPLGLFSLVASIFYQMIYVEKFLESEGGFNPRAIILVMTVAGMGIIGPLSTLYGSAQFQSILEDTASGNDCYQRPGIITEWFGSFFHLAYVGFCTLFPSITAGAIAATTSRNPGLLLVGLIPALLLFPPFLLSSMAADSPLALLNGNVLRGFLRKPLLLPVLFVTSSVLAAVCLGLGYLTLTTSNFFIALATGFGWSACLIIYARLLGRVGWVLSQSGVKVRKRRKRRRKKPTPSPEDWGDETDNPNTERPAKIEGI